MSTVIRISESIFQRLQKTAVPLEDTPASVIERLLDFYERRNSVNNVVQQPERSRPARVKELDNNRNVEKRRPRQRGVTVEINGERISATSVFDLYSKVLKFLSYKQHLEKLRPHLPLPTSSKRYLIATKPFHPNGNEFMRPVEYRGYIMESHKDYKNGINHLRKMLDLCGLSLRYIA